MARPGGEAAEERGAREPGPSPANRTAATRAAAARSGRRRGITPRYCGPACALSGGVAEGGDADTAREGQTQMSSAPHGGRRRRWISAGAAAATAQGAALLDEVDQHVVAQGLGGGEEGPAPVHLGEPLHEGLEVAV